MAGVTVAAATVYHWRLEEFVRAWEAEVFVGRAELVDGEVWPVAIGSWHGDVAARVVRALPNDDHQVTTSSLPTSGSLPDPDCWVRPTAAHPQRRLSDRLDEWAPADVLLVVEVGDETVDQDLGAKAVLYARGGYRWYWVVTREGVYEHSDPGEVGYQVRHLRRPGDSLTVEYANVQVLVDDLLPGD